MPKHIVAYCYEGLCNRLDTLIAASFLANRYKCAFSFFWMDEICNDIHPSEIFVHMNANLLTQEDFLNFVKTNATNIFAMGRNILNIGDLVHLNVCEQFNSNVSLEILDATDKDIILIQTCTIPYWAVNANALHSFYSRFMINPELIKKPLAKIAIHIRGTDMLETFAKEKGTSVADVVNVAISISQKHPGELIMICSDDEIIEKELQNYVQFVMFKKTYVGKINDKNGYNKVHEEEINSCNVKRSKDQVLGGITDLFALVQADHLYCYEKTCNNSTFYFLASLIHKLKILPWKLQQKYIL